MRELLFIDTLGLIIHHEGRKNTMLKRNKKTDTQETDMKANYKEIQKCT